VGGLKGAALYRAAFSCIIDYIKVKSGSLRTQKQWSESRKTPIDTVGKAGQSRQGADRSPDF